MDILQIQNGLMNSGELTENLDIQDAGTQCPKDVNCYVADWRCKGKCPNYRISSGWSWLGDECALANKL